ncbi:putative RNA-directed DNA polymerase, eukaryota, reverse transcriptase zinc-binding domain protein [Tanacetum coccineum]
MFAFCRFIKVLDSDTLINSISNIWIGKLRLHANVARYARKEESKLSHTVVKVANSNSIPFATKNHNDSYFCKTSSYANVIKASDNEEFKDVGDSHHSVSLQMENSNEFPLAILEADKAEFFENKDAESTVGLANDIGYENIYINNDQVHDECAHKVLVTTHKYGSMNWILPSRRGVGSVSCDKQEYDVSREHLGFSLVERLEETIKVWVNSHFDFASTSARGMSGEIICIWNSLLFCKSRIVCNENYVVVEGLWIPNDVRLMWIVVYDPQNLPSKIALWSSLTNILSNWDGNLIVMGDFNEVREAGERYGSIFNERQAEIFNEFISNSALIDIPLGVILEKGIPDHRPILLKEFVADYGPTPFRFFNSWLDMEGFHDLVSQTWHHDGIVEACGFTSLKKKLQNLKSIIRAWVASKKSESSMIKRDHESRLASIDAKVDQGCANEEDFINRRDSIKILDDIHRMEAKDLAQKAKVKWAIEGEENTSFFHGMLKKKRRQLAIKGILKNGEWIEDPAMNRLSLSQSESLEIQFSHEEIKRAVWECGGDRAPGPDGFSFKFLTTFWDLIKVDVVRFVHEFFLIGTFPKGCNSSFIALIPKVIDAKFVSDFRPISLIGCQYKIIGKLLANRLSSVIGDVISPEQSAFIKGRNILDGPLIINEVMDWYRKRKKDLMIFNVDFEKAFDSLRWDFLDLVMEKLGFGHKWRSWIYGCLHNARSLVLVNGSPTTEFEAQETGLFKGASVGHSNMIISPLIYADDVIFISEWSWQNAHNLLCMLRYFYLISWLKINVNKSNIFGVSVSDERVSNMANSIGCGADIFPMNYLGVPVGCNMTRCANWSVIIKKFSSKLASWKSWLLSKLESIRNNFFLGGDVEEKKMTWVRWKKCLASKDLGGLGIGSIFRLNIVSCSNGYGVFFHCSSDLWARVIKNIYGPCGGINDTPGNRLSHSTWGGILSSFKRIKQKGIDLLSYCVRKIGDGTSTRFWEDTWCGDQPLKITFPRIYLLDTDKDCFIVNRISLQDLCSSFRRQPRAGAEMTQFLELQAKIENVVLSDQGDTWKWSVGSATCFSVAFVRYQIDSKTVTPSNLRTQRNV